MSDLVVLPGAREVRGALDRAGGRSDAGESAVDRIVVACPPHPQYGGSRTDSRLTAVADALGERDVDCLRFDYGPWDGGRGEREDARSALRWAAERYDRVGIFGYSFGGAVALLAAAGSDDPLRSVSTLAPAARLDGDLDAIAAVDDLPCPLQVIYGTRDDTVDAEAVAERARERGHAVESIPADHFFVGQRERIGELAGDFLSRALSGT